MGLNVGLYQVLVTIFLIKLYPGSFKSRAVIAATILTLVAAVMVIWHNSFISKFAYVASSIVMVGFVHQPRLQAVFYGALNGVQAWLVTFLEGLQGLIRLPKNSIILKKTTGIVLYRLRLVIIPILIFFVFFAIFKFANPVFDQMTNQGLQVLGEWVQQFNLQISPVWIIFMVFGAWMSGFTLFNWRKEDVWQLEQAKKIQLIRVKRLNKERILDFHMVSLRQEYKVGLITFALVNVLLLIINSIDINFLWFNFDYGRAGDLTALVHKGTYLLILSILLAMGVILYFFCRNLNFYPKNQWLKRLAYAWILQNAILVISVALRTWYYIDATGLAYKRIGVLIYLFLTMFGLYTMYRKINRRKTTFYLWKTNSWATYAMMILMTTINWDRLIVDYNFTHHNSKNEFVLNRSDRTLDLVHYQIQKWNKNDKQARIYPPGHTYISSLSKEVYVQRRINRFKKEQKGYSWLSWNYGDWRTRQYFLSKKE